MKSAIRTFVILMFACLTPALAQHTHDCDLPLTHYEHGADECGNVATDRTTHPTNCRDESVKLNGTLWNAEYLACGPQGSPSGGYGCSYQFIARCGGRIQSGEIGFGLSYDGSYPACQRVNILGGLAGIPDQRGYECTSHPTATTTVAHLCYCNAQGAIECS